MRVQFSKPHSFVANGIGEIGPKIDEDLH
jgi:hypothetical protein